MSELAPEETKRTGRVKHGEGLNDYLTLGPDRSLEKLCRWYTENMLKPPALVTLKTWSSKYGWQAKAATHDVKVASQVAEKAEEAAVEDGWDRVKVLNDVARRCLEKAAEALGNEKIAPATAYEVQSLINTAATAIKTGELLAGRPTDRFGVIDAKAHAPEWMVEKLKDSAPAPPPTAAAIDDEVDIPENAMTRH